MIPALTVKDIREGLEKFPDDALVALELGDRFFGVLNLLELAYPTEDGVQVAAGLSAKLNCDCEKCKGSCGPETS